MGRKITTSFYIDEEILDLFAELGIENTSAFVNDYLLYILRRMKEIRDRNTRIRDYMRHPYQAVFDLVFSRV